MEDGDILVFIEVRLRQSARFGSALESVTYQKQQRLIQTAQRYLQQNTCCYGAYRFDVIGLCADNIDWVKDAFQLN
ncbi:UNVERIFIED_CONTAM: hypothetical protein GTU68_003860 [Idotea baltica]|nr:hypothetical protein [Idotea baltica]